MKIGIITHYGVHNHGAVLQLYGLIKTLEEYGHQAKALSFKKNYDFMAENIDKKYEISIKSIFIYFEYLLQHGFSRTLYNIKKKTLLDKFRVNLVGEYYSRATNLDAVFIGSDEVFSFESGINPFFYGFGIPCNKIYSYAGCFGPYTLEQIERKRLSGFVKAGLFQMDKISVRDYNSKKIVKAISGIDAEEVCDPVILYGFMEEQQRLTVKLPKKKYLLVYSYDNNMNDPQELKKITDFAKRHGLITISAGFYHKWCDKCVNASPLELIQYFKNAECVVTDTFHGSVISLITGSQFTALIRGNKNKLFDLLNRYDVADRCVSDLSNLEDSFNNKIDYNRVEGLLEKARQSSLLYLESCLKDATNE